MQIIQYYVLNFRSYFKLTGQSIAFLTLWKNSRVFSHLRIHAIKECNESLLEHHLTYLLCKLGWKSYFYICKLLQTLLAHALGCFLRYNNNISVHKFVSHILTLAPAAGPQIENHQLDFCKHAQTGSTQTHYWHSLCCCVFFHSLPRAGQKVSTKRPAPTTRGRNLKFLVCFFCFHGVRD